MKNTKDFSYWIYATDWKYYFFKIFGLNSAIANGYCQNERKFITQWSNLGNASFANNSKTSEIYSQKIT